MTLMEQLTALSLLDGAAVGLLLAGWFGIGWLIEHPPGNRPSVSVLMARFRREWMQVFLTRSPRIFDAQIMSSLRQGTAFFASTSLLALGALLALLGNADPLRGVTGELINSQSSTLLVQLKLLLVAVFLSNAFLKFVWANRVFGYSSVVMASVPNDPEEPGATHRAAQAAELNIRAALNLNRGLRAWYFALASLAWILGPEALLGATVLTLWLLWSREFRSRPRDIILSKGMDE